MTCISGSFTHCFVPLENKGHSTLAITEYVTLRLALHYNREVMTVPL